MLTEIQLPVQRSGPLTLAEDIESFVRDATPVPSGTAHMHSTRPQACSHPLVQRLGHVPIIAEDLGVITSDVNELRKAIGAPGMVVLQFAWGSGAQNTHIPHNHYENSICYPGKFQRASKFLQE